MVFMVYCEYLYCILCIIRGCNTFRFGARPSEMLFGFVLVAIHHPKKPCYNQPTENFNNIFTFDYFYFLFDNNEQRGEKNALEEFNVPNRLQIIKFVEKRR